MLKELQKKFEELGKCMEEMDKEQNIMSIDYNHRTKLVEVHVLEKDFPAHHKCHEEYVWLGGKDYSWHKQVIINGVMYYDCITQEQFDKEHATEVA